MKSRKKSFFKLFMALFCFVALIVSVYFILKAVENHLVQKADSELFSSLSKEEFGHVDYNGKTYAPKKRLTTFLLLGIDEIEKIEESNSYTNSYQADFITLFVFDNKNKSVTFLQLNRDTMTEIPVLGVRGEKAGTITAQLALAHTYGSGLEDSCQNTVDAVSNLLFDIRIDNYMSLTMNAVSIVNDLIGGVEVEVLDDFSGVDPSLIKGEKIKLSGSQALNYVRSRGGVGDQTNISRMHRQKQYMNSFAETLAKAYESDNKIGLKIIESVGDNAVTNCTVNKLDSIVSSLSDYTFNGIFSPDGENVVGDRFMEHYLDQDSLMEIVLNIFYDEVA